METENTMPANFEDLLLTHDKPILVDFWAEWCPPCKMMNPILKQLAGEWKDKITVIKVNVDEKPYLASRYGIASIPTLILFSKGKEAKRSVGAMSFQNLKNTYSNFI